MSRLGFIEIVWATRRFFTFFATRFAILGFSPTLSLIMRTSWCLLFLLSVMTAGCSSRRREIGPVAFSPDGTVIVFSYSDGDSSHIYEAPFSNLRSARIPLSGCDSEFDPTFSPDGKTMVFSCRVGGKSHIYLANSDGSSAHALAATEFNDEEPIFSPDGKQIYFASTRFFGNYSPIAAPHAHDWDIFVTDISGTNVKQVTSENFYGISAPTVSPDGKNLMFVNAAEENQIRIYALDKSGKPRIIRPTTPSTQVGSILVGPQYSHDGTRVYFMAASDGSEGFDYDIYRMDSTGDNVERLTKGNGYATGARVSPDGKSVLFFKWKSDWHRTPVENSLYALDVSSRQIRKLDLQLPK
jgi:Tol biopolymer transport system component